MKYFHILVLSILVLHHPFVFLAHGKESSEGLDNDEVDRRPETHSHHWESLADSMEEHVPPPIDIGCYPYGSINNCVPQQWEGKTKSHTPIVTKLVDYVSHDEEEAFSVQVKHGSEPNHFIGLLYVRAAEADGSTGEILKLEEFSGNHKGSLSFNFSIPTGVNYVVAYSFCNLHGLWKSSLFDTTSGKTQEDKKKIENEL